MKELTIDAQANKKFKKASHIFDNLEYLGFTEKEALEVDYNYIKLYYLPLINKFGINVNLDDDYNFYQLNCIDSITLALNYPKFISHFFKLRKTILELSLQGKI
ncbi:hypothetical protein [Arcobacter sp.]|uniref:hypothetical protein n=1 Tax=unclassified Arcobacter TaxID=2593671 RepID=UPI003B00776B